MTSTRNFSAGFLHRLRSERRSIDPMNLWGDPVTMAGSAGLALRSPECAG